LTDNAAKTIKAVNRINDLRIFHTFWF
jgi:hypothetical protein